MLVFVYGSLKKGFRNHSYFLEENKLLGSHITAPKFTMVSLGGFPGVLKGGETPISGEIYEINEGDLQRLDRLEGHPTFYCREQISTPYGDSWIYFLQGRHGDTNKVESGIWEEHR